MEKLHQNLPNGGRKELNSHNKTPTSQICMAMIFMSCFMKYIEWVKEVKIQVFRDMAPCQLVNSYQLLEKVAVSIFGVQESKNRLLGLFSNISVTMKYSEMPT